MVEVKQNKKQNMSWCSQRINSQPPKNVIFIILDCLILQGPEWLSICVLLFCRMFYILSPFYFYSFLLRSETFMISISRPLISCSRTWYMKVLCPRRWESDNTDSYTCVCHVCHGIRVQPANCERKGTVGILVLLPLSLQTRKPLRDSPVTIHTATLGVHFPDWLGEIKHIYVLYGSRVWTIRRW